LFARDYRRQDVDRARGAQRPASERSQGCGVFRRRQRGAATKIGAHSCIQVSSAPACLSPLRYGRARPAPRQSAAARARPLPSLSSIRLPLSCAYATITAGTICAATVASPAGLRAQGAPIGAGIARAVAAAGGTATNAGITTEVAPSQPASVFGRIARSAESISSAHRAIRRGRGRKKTSKNPSTFCRPAPAVVLRASRAPRYRRRY
jgi:hypothetical protein